MIRPDATSRYNYAELITDAAGVDFYGTRRPVRIKGTADDALHRVTDADRKRIDLIAYKYYGDVRLWWVIAEANGIGNPLELQPGAMLRIPPYEAVMMKVVR